MLIIYMQISYTHIRNMLNLPITYEIQIQSYNLQSYILNYFDIDYIPFIQSPIK